MSNFSYEIVDNIIISKALDNITPERFGLGYAFFYEMKKHGNKIAQVDAQTGHEQSYNTLIKRCIRTAIEMSSRGINQGDIISICSYNQMDSTVPFYATLFLGARVASLDPTLSLDDTVHLLKQVQPKMIFFSDNATTLIERSLASCELEESTQTVIFGTTNGRHAAFDEFVEYKDGERSFEPVQVCDSETAVIFFSSGTTGLPKGVELSHYSLLMQGLNFRECCMDSTCMLGTASLYWISSVIFAICTVLGGSLAVVCRAFDPETVWYLIEKFKVTMMFMAPSNSIKTLKHGRPDEIDTTSLMDLLIGGGTLSTDTLNLVRDIFPGTNVHIAYGQTEVGGVITYFKPISREDILLMNVKGNSCGRPMPGFSYKVVDIETNEVLGPNQTGELHLQSDFCMTGYFNMDSSSAWDDEGWLRTGDVVYYDDDLCFYIIDRIKELLKFQSWHVTPAKIEGVLLTHTGVAQAIVIGIPNEDDGDHPLGVVVKNLNSDVTEEELVKYVEERVDDRQRLRGGVVFLDQLPYTPSGKVKRNEVKDMIRLRLSKKD